MAYFTQKCNTHIYLYFTAIYVLRFITINFLNSDLKDILKNSFTFINKILNKFHNFNLYILYIERERESLQYIYIYTYTLNLYLIFDKYPKYFNDKDIN